MLEYSATLCSVFYSGFLNVWDEIFQHKWTKKWIYKQIDLDFDYNIDSHTFYRATL